ncbi:MAG: cystathionine gamma-synthase [Thermomicrobiales bacterium]|nr:cystathionine gamma-synthase [Thermomicrobiales bacterium]MCO5217383.1 cystathionine gamma-synthase [Thermomicrobiales bacterium]MCO5224656.1 cystathionine gamma-synthase [Thermomicrobiales bacterium]
MSDKLPNEFADWSDTSIETRCIRAGQDPDPRTGSMIVPIFQTSTFKWPEVGTSTGYEYSRTANPTRAALQASIASLEGAEWGLAFASGTAAMREVAMLLNPGEHILMARDAYGGTFRLLDVHTRRHGIDVSMVDLTDLEQVEGGIRPNTKLIWLETPTNPIMAVADIAAIADIAHTVGALLSVDNTFATPYLQQPLALGADLVIHSATKYLAGHSDVVIGAVVGNDPDLFTRLQEQQNDCGAVPSPFDSWLTLRGIKTLPVRMDRHGANAIAVANFLNDHPNVAEVYYPGLPEAPGHELAQKQMRNFGGMVSFRMPTREAAIHVCNSTRIFQLAESLGGVESLIEHPDSMTHLAVSGTEFAIDGGVIRASIGIENIDDLIADLEQALAGVR